eukprot:gene9628-12964_t
MTHNPLHNNSSNNIYLLAVLRYSDKVIVACYHKNKDITIPGVRECIASNSTIQINKRYSINGENQAIHYHCDSTGRIFIIVTGVRYPPRLAFVALDEFESKFNKDLGVRIAAASEGSLTRVSLSLMRDICDKFENPANVDKLAAVTDKVEIVKSTMKESIQQLLINEEKMNQIEAAAVHLNEQSVVFNKSATQLKDKMWWKMWKMRLLIGGLVVSVLLIIILTLTVSVGGTSKK